MTLNYIWIFFFVIAFVVAVVKALMGDTTIFTQLTTGMFDSAKTGAEISIGLVGIMTFWLGIMKIGERAGLINLLSKWLAPFFSKLFPEVPKGHAANGSVMMNFSANMLGLDNAATPLGLTAMKELQALNTKPETATNAQIMFLALNTAGLTIIPSSVIAIRMSNGAANPADIFLPTLIVTFCSFISAMIAVAAFQKINLFKLPVFVFVGGFCLLMFGLFFWLNGKEATYIQNATNMLGAGIIFSIIIAFILKGFFAKINVYEAFIDGAKEGFQTSITIIPYLVAILVAISVFRTSGCMGYLIDALGKGFAALGMNTDFVPTLPVGFMKTLSGGGARGLMIDVIKTYGVDSFQGKLASIIQGGTETTFYVLAVYFGSVGIKKSRHAVACGLIADAVGLIAAIIVGYAFFH